MRDSSITRVAWVTGASGFLGRHAAQRLAGGGWRVFGVGGRAAPSDPTAWGMEAWAAGMMSADVLATFPPPALVLHAAGVGTVSAAAGDPLEGFRRTVESTALLLDVLRRIAPRARVLYPSTAAVYGGRGDGKLHEDAPLAPVSSYGWHKVMAECLLRDAAASHGQPTTVIRFFSLYGSGLRKQVLWDWCRGLSVNAEVYKLGGTGEEVRDFLHVDDAAELIALLAEIAEERLPTVINGASGKGQTMRATAAALAAALGREADNLIFDGFVRPGDPPRLVGDTTRLKALGFRPRTSFADGLRRYVEWFRATVLGDEP